MATIKDVAREAGVSIASVSYVLNNSRTVSKVTKEKVLSAVEKVGYVPNAAARALKTGSSGIIGVVIVSNLNHYYSEVLHWIDIACQESNYSTLVSYPVVYSGREIKAMEQLLERDVDGLILNVINPDNVIQPFLKTVDKPCVLVSRNLPEVRQGLVYSDDYWGASRAVRHLLSLNHRRIGIVTFGSEKSNTFSSRLSAYQDVLAEAEIPFDKDLVYLCDFKTENGVDAFHHFMSLKSPPTAVFCCADVLAMGFYKAAEEVGLSIPEELSVIGYDDILFAKYMIPPLTTVRQDKKLIGSTAVSQLIRRIRNPELPPAETKIPVELVIRDSTAKLD